MTDSHILRISEKNIYSQVHSGIRQTSHILRISEKTKQKKETNKKPVVLCKGISSHGMKTWDNRHRPAHVTTGLIALQLRRRLSVMGNLDVVIDSQAFDSKLDTRSASCTWPNYQQIKHRLA